MIYLRPTHSPEKKGHSESLFKVTIELQYANENDEVTSQSFILFWLHDRLKLVIQRLHMVNGTQCPAWSDKVKKWIERRAVALKGRCPGVHG